MFQKFRTEIVVISVGDPKLDSEQAFEEIAFMLHYYLMNMYSKRRNHSIGLDMKANRTEQVYIGKNDTVSAFCHTSKNLHNQANIRATIH